MFGDPSIGGYLVAICYNLGGKVGNGPEPAAVSHWYHNYDIRVFGQRPTNCVGLDKLRNIQRIISFFVCV